ALELRSPEERQAYLDRACAGNAGLRTHVESLLAASASAGSFLGEPAVQRAVEELQGQACAGATNGGPPGDEGTPLGFLGPSQKPGSLGRLGHYEVLALLGRGGMGRVFKAFDETLHRVVAIKVMAPQLPTSASARPRFV